MCCFLVFLAKPSFRRYLIRLALSPSFFDFYAASSLDFPSGIVGLSSVSLLLVLVSLVLLVSNWSNSVFLFFFSVLSDSFVFFSSIFLFFSVSAIGVFCVYTSTLPCFSFSDLVLFSACCCAFWTLITSSFLVYGPACISLGSASTILLLVFADLFLLRAL